LYLQSSNSGSHNSYLSETGSVPIFINFFNPVFRVFGCSVLDGCQGIIKFHGGFAGGAVTDMDLFVSIADFTHRRYHGCCA